MATKTDNDNARALLLEAALNEFWTKGYNGTRVDEIIAKTPFTKGAFYHHFASKKALALAVIDETLGAMMQQRWLEPLQDATDPFASLIGQLNAARHDGDEGVRRGCPLNNLAQEIAHEDEDIRAAVNRHFEGWQQGFAEAIAESQERGQVRPEIDPQALAAYIVASYEGAVSLAKAAHSAAMLNTAIDPLVAHLESLRTKQ